MSSPVTMSMEHPASETTSFRMTAVLWLALAAGVGALGLLIWHSLTASHHGSHGSAHLPPLWGLGIVPFLAILGCIAVLPLIPATHHWWESNMNRLGIALTVGAVTVLYTVWHAGFVGALTVLDHAIVAEYIPFIVLLFALYVVSGGISLTGDLRATPLTNCTFLAIGAAIASFIGTTGASMLLIRPLLKTNSERKHVVHTVVFFIFLVSNIGGTLLPIGDPPLFLGFLYGVPFFWTFNLLAEWAVACVILLVIYFVWDSIMYKNEAVRDIKRDDTQLQPLRMKGFINLVWMAGVVFSVAFLSPGKQFTLGPISFMPFPFMREMMMLLFVGLSLWTTPTGVRATNKFNYAAIGEVAALFIGIFIAMQVPLEVLKYYGPELTTSVVTEPWHYFWATGGLSSFLDNAPTYVVFFKLAETMSLDPAAATVVLEGGKGVIGTSLLVAISLGAVFMGAMTYIGNGPNFMVKAIAEQSGVKMPSFFGFMFKYSIPVLIPVFVIIMVLFLL